MFVGLALAAQASAVPCADEIAALLAEHAYVRALADGSLVTRDDIDRANEDELNELLRQADRYASYVPAEVFSRIRDLKTAGPAGVGMDIVFDSQGRIRCIPYPDSPADIAGIEYGSVLLSVDGFGTDGLPIEDVAALIRGKKDSDVELTVEGPDGEIYVAVVTRSVQRYPDVALIPGNSVGIKIFRFGPNTAEHLKAVFRQFQEEYGETGRRFYLDLRGNTGGVLQQAAECAAMFLPPDSVLYRYATEQEVTNIKTDGSARLFDGRFLILQDAFTASSAEMMIVSLKAGADVSTFGSKSAGKSRVQEVFRLSDGGAIKITVGELRYPKQRGTWQDIGLEPDIRRGGPEIRR